jgi:hypothetical protein
MTISLDTCTIVATVNALLSSVTDAARRESVVSAESCFAASMRLHAILVGSSAAQ